MALRPETIPDSAVRVTDAEVRAFYEKNPKLFDRPGRAVLSLVSIPRTVTAADSAAARQRAEARAQRVADGLDELDRPAVDIAPVVRMRPRLRVAGGGR